MNYYIFSLMYMSIFAYFAHLARVSKIINITLIILTAIVVNIPINGISFNMITYSFLGEMSMFLFALCLMSIFENLKKKPMVILDFKAAIFVFIFGLILYLSTLNLIPLDLYYQSPQVVIIICCLIAILAYFIQPTLGILYLICLLGYALKILDSKNLFDYFIDVPTWLLAIISILTYGGRKMITKIK